MLLETNEVTSIIEVCQNIQTSADSHDWESYVTSFTDKVIIDYSSYFHFPATPLTREQCVANAKLALPKFDHTMHIMTNFKAAVTSDTTAVASCYVEALHVIKGAKGGDALTLFGKYDFKLEKLGKDWKVNSMKFTFIHQDGNKDLFAISATR